MEPFENNLYAQPIPKHQRQRSGSRNLFPDVHSSPEIIVAGQGSFGIHHHPVKHHNRQASYVNENMI